MTNEELDEAIDALWKETKAGLMPREGRFLAITNLTDTYIETTGKRPPGSSLDRLSSLCLYEEISDPTPWKSRNVEYNIHSPRQREEIYRNEVGEVALMNLATDGNNHLPPTRRPRSKYELQHIARTYNRSEGTVE